MLDDDLPKLRVGDKVYYTYQYQNPRFQNGIIKTIVGQNIYVVYNCNANWDNYKDYTGLLSPISALTLGWK